MNHDHLSNTEFWALLAQDQAAAAYSSAMYCRQRAQTVSEDRGVAVYYHEVASAAQRDAAVRSAYIRQQLGIV